MFKHLSKILRQSRETVSETSKDFRLHGSTSLVTMKTFQINKFPKGREILIETLTRRFSPDLLVVVVVVVVCAGGCPASWGTCCAGGVAPTVTPPVGIVAPTPVTIVPKQFLYHRTEIKREIRQIV